MPDPEKIIELRNELLDHCQGLLSELDMSENIITTSTTEITFSKTSADNKTTTGTLDSHSANNITIGRIRVAIHAGMINEWWIFLDQVYGEAILHNLKKNSFQKSCETDIDLKELRTKNINELLESISYASKTSFSFLSYKNKLDTLKSLFVTTDDSPSQEMKKHVLIRNIFQHNRGQIREIDLEEIGRSNQHLELFDEKGNLNRYKAGDAIILSKIEVENCCKVIEKYSNNFQTLKT